MRARRAIAPRGGGVTGNEDDGAAARPRPEPPRAVGGPPGGGPVERGFRGGGAAIIGIRPGASEPVERCVGRGGGVGRVGPRIAGAAGPPGSRPAAFARPAGVRAAGTLARMTPPKPHSAAASPADGDAASGGPGDEGTDGRPGLLVVVSGPSGVGKTTIVHALRDRLPAMLSISATTRPKSAQETDGVHYVFLGEAEFERRVAAGDFIEHAKVFGRNWYGTPREPVERALADGRVVILEIDVQGALQVRRSMPGAFLVFIEPPSEEELLRRLRARGREGEEAIARRFAEAKHERATARESGAYDAFLVNEALEAACAEACRLVEDERARRAADAEAG